MEIVDNTLAKPGSIALIPLTAEAVEGIDLKPGALAQFLLTHLRGDTDVFDLPDLSLFPAATVRGVAVDRGESEHVGSRGWLP
jgi:hypothetical protein